MLNARQENEKSLARLLGLGDDQAAEKLNTRVAVLAIGDDQEAFAQDLAVLLGMTLHVVGPADDCELAVHIGQLHDHPCPSALVASFDGERLRIGWASKMPKIKWASLHGLSRKISACYSAGFVISNAIGGAVLDRAGAEFNFDISNLGLDAGMLTRPIDIDGAVIVGAGGVANGFLWALRELRVTGHVIIADPKAVSEGNLNRCFYFSQSDIGEPKAVRLAEHAAFEGVTLQGYLGTFQDFVASYGSARLVITTPDSRRARRLVQDQLPLAVIDASTTDLSGVVIHSHHQLTEHACLGCIYPFIQAEGARELDIAAGLGVSVEDVQAGIISEAAARKIVAAHSDLDVESLVGVSFESLYKAKCAEGALLTGAGVQALAPFGFISALAGALQVLELTRFKTGIADPSNYMNLDPWVPPHAHARRLRGRLSTCHFCSRPESVEALRAVWGDDLGS